MHSLNICQEGIAVFMKYYRYFLLPSMFMFVYRMLTRVLLWHDNTIDKMKAHGVDFVTRHLTALILFIA